MRKLALLGACVMVLASPSAIAQSLYIHYALPYPGAEIYERNHPGSLLPGDATPNAVDPALLTEAQAMVNQFAYVPDAMGDVWRASFVGDCEDKALAAMAWLIAHGVPGSSMRVLVSPPTKQREGHAILCIWDNSADPECLDVMADQPTRLSAIDGIWYRVQ